MAMLSPIYKATIQASFLSILSSTLAQLLQAYRNNSLPSHPTLLNPLGLRYLPIFQFLFCALATTPANFLWQAYLESQLPTYSTQPDQQKIKVDDDGKGVIIEQKLDLRNTGLKLVIDQSIGGALNTIAFLFLMAAVRGGSFSDCTEAVRLEFWPLLLAGYRIWPVVSLLNFLVVPVERRVVVASAVGLFWGIYLVLRVSN